MKLVFLAAPLLSLVMAASELTVLAGVQDIDRGRRLAHIWCTSCHEVDSVEGSSSALARAFSQIANDPYLDRGHLRGWLVAPHPPMPDPKLEDAEIADLISYILSLRE